MSDEVKRPYFAESATGFLMTSGQIWKHTGGERNLNQGGIMARVLILGSFSESLLRFRGHLIRRLLDEGHEVIAAAPGTDWKVVETLESWGAQYREVPLERTGMSPAADLKTLWHLHRLFLREQPDIFLGYTIKPVVYGLLAAWLADVPARYALITGLGSAFTQVESSRQYLLQLLASTLYGLSLRTSQRVIFQNPDDAYLFCARRLVGGPEEVALVNGSGVDLEEYTPVPLPQEPIFLLIGRILREKGILEYVEAARRIKRVHKTARFQLVGWCDDNPSAIGMDQVQSWVKEGVIDYLGHLEDVRPAIARAAVYVLPSYREGTPRTVLEAMAMGRPIVTTDAPGCRQTVVPGVNGFLVPVANIDALARAMTHFIGEPALVEEMGLASRRMVEDRFDVHRVNDALVQALELSAPVRKKRVQPPPLPPAALG